MEEQESKKPIPPNNDWSAVPFMEVNKRAEFRYPTNIHLRTIYQEGVGDRMMGNPPNLTKYYDRPGMMFEAAAYSQGYVDEDIRRNGWIAQPTQKNQKQQRMW
jgi:hypothetical protein